MILYSFPAFLFHSILSLLESPVDVCTYVSTPTMCVNKSLYKTHCCQLVSISYSFSTYFTRFYSILPLCVPQWVYVCIYTNYLSKKSLYSNVMDTAQQRPLTAQCIRSFRHSVSKNQNGIQIKTRLTLGRKYAGSLHTQAGGAPLLALCWGHTGEGHVS